MSPFELPSLRFRPLRYRYRGVGDWSGHIPFARDLIAAIEPRLFVELGTHYAESYFAFCQSIREQGCDTKAFAIDTWCGDVHTGGYSGEVFEDVTGHNHSHYADFSTLLRMRFDEARDRFSDHTIDVLHIDGLHDYASVRHDFEAWLPKMAPGGVVLFHDIGVRREDFGVWQFWQEVEETYTTWAFVHSSGLGVLRVPGKREFHGILDVLFRTGAEYHTGILQYYEMCAERLDYLHAQAQELHWDIVGQLYWRSQDEAFEEGRSSRTWSTLSTSSSAVCVKAVAPSNPCELRLDLTKGCTALRLFKVSLLNAAGSLVWELDGDEFIRTTRHTGLVQVTGSREGNLVVVVGENGISILMAVSGASFEVGSELAVRIDLCGVPPDTVAHELAKFADRNRALDQSLGVAQRAVAERTQEFEKLTGALARAEALVLEHQQQLCRYDAALGEAQRVVAERTQAVESLTGALARAEALVLEHQQQLCRYDAALGEAQRVVAERTQAVESLTGALAGAEALLQEHQQQLRRYDAALGEAQQAVAERTQEVENLTATLARAETLVQGQHEDVRRYESDLSEVRQVATERTQEVKNLKNALARAETLLRARSEELRRSDGALGEAERLATERTWEVEKLNSRLAETTSSLERAEAALGRAVLNAEQARARLRSMESSLSWRLGRPVRTLERLARSISDRS
jgi:hypothetical protein